MELQTFSNNKGRGARLQCKSQQIDDLVSNFSLNSRKKTIVFRSLPRGKVEYIKEKKKKTFEEEGRDMEIVRPEKKELEKEVEEE